MVSIFFSTIVFLLFSPFIFSFAFAFEDDDGALYFAIIGDMGTADSHEEKVSELVGSWDDIFGLQFVGTTGDNQYVHDYLNHPKDYDETICPYYGQFHSTNYSSDCNATSNRFFPAAGNHDWTVAKPTDVLHGDDDSDNDVSGYEAYQQFFHINPGDDDLFYYKVLDGSSGTRPWLLYAVLNVNCNETCAGGSSPDSGNHGCSKDDLCAYQYEKQVENLQKTMVSVNAIYSIAVMHQGGFPPDESKECKSVQKLDFQNSTKFHDAEGNGLAMVISGHKHVYGRVGLVNNTFDNTTFITNGFSGAELSNCYDDLYSDKMLGVFCYEKVHGAILMKVTENSLNMQAYSIHYPDDPIDNCTMSRPNGMNMGTYICCDSDHDYKSKGVQPDKCSS